MSHQRIEHLGMANIETPVGLFRRRPDDGQIVGEYRTTGLSFHPRQRYPGAVGKELDQLLGGWFWLKDHRRNPAAGTGGPDHRAESQLDHEAVEELPVLDDIGAFRHG